MVKKKLLSLLIAAVMVLAMVPATAWATGITMTVAGGFTIDIKNTDVVVLTSNDYNDYLAKTKGNDAVLMDYVNEYSADLFENNTVCNVVTNGDGQGSDSAFILLFAKPEEGYVLTTFGSGITYYIDYLSSGNATTYAISESLQKTIGEALSDAGYVAVLGYSRTYSDTVSLGNFKAYSEELVTVEKTVNSITDSSNNTVIESDIDSYKVDVGDKITYKITVTKIATTNNKKITYSDFLLLQMK